MGGVYSDNCENINTTNMLLELLNYFAIKVETVRQKLLMY